MNDFLDMFRGVFLYLALWLWLIAVTVFYVDVAAKILGVIQ